MPHWVFGCDIAAHCIVGKSRWGGLVGCIPGISSKSVYIPEFFGTLQSLLMFKYSWLLLVESVCTAGKTHCFENSHRFGTTQNFKSLSKTKKSKTSSSEFLHCLLQANGQIQLQDFS